MGATDWNVVVCMKTDPKGSYTIKRYGIFGVDMALLEDMCHWWVGFEVLEVQARPSVSLPVAC